jgi:hypothetical protein
MGTGRRSLCLVLIIGVLLSIVALSGLGPSPAKAQAPGVEDEDDADLPRIGRGRIDKNEYLGLRDAHVNRLRGVPYDRPDARVRAIREMEGQEIEFGPTTSSSTWTSIGPAPIPNGQTSPVTSVSGAHLFNRRPRD